MYDPGPDGGLPDPNNPEQPMAPGPPVYDEAAKRRDQIKAVYQGWLGRAPNENDYNSWMGNDDFENQIRASPEAQAYAAANHRNPNTGQPQPQQQQAGGATQFTRGMSRQQAEQAVAQYFQSRGVQPYPTSINSWGGYWDAWGKNDPEYFMRRLEKADEFGGGFQTEGGGSGQSSGGSSSQRSSGATYATDPYVAAAIQRLLSRGEAGTSASDPNIKGPTDAFRAQTDTNVRRTRAALAERAASEGLNSGGAGSGAFDSAIQSQLEQQGRDVGSYQGNLMTKEIEAKRQDVIAALGFSQGEERNRLSAMLADLNDQLQRAQLGQQNTQFYDTMGYSIGRDNSQYNYLMAQLLAR